MRRAEGFAEAWSRLAARGLEQDLFLYRDRMIFKVPTQDTAVSCHDGKHG